MVSILNPDLYARFSTSEGMRMKLLSKEETSIVKAFLKVPIPEYVLAYADGQIDLLDCYEVAFNFANELLRGRKINPNASPWGDGRSVIFEPYYLSANISNYCDLFLKVLDVFKDHLV